MLLPFFFSFFPFMKGEKKATGSFIFHYDLDDLQFFWGFFVGFFFFFLLSKRVEKELAGFSLDFSSIF